MELVFYGLLCLIFSFLYQFTEKSKRLSRIIELHNQSEIDKFLRKYSDFKINTLGNDFANIDSYFQYVNSEGEKILALTSNTKRSAPNDITLYSHEDWLVKQGYIFYKKDFGKNGILILENLLEVKNELT